MRYSADELQDEIASLWRESQTMEETVVETYSEQSEALVQQIIDAVTSQNIEPHSGNHRNFGCVGLQFVHGEVAAVNVTESYSPTNVWRVDEDLSIDEQGAAARVIIIKKEEILDAISEMENIHLIAERDKQLAIKQRLEALVSNINRARGQVERQIAGGVNDLVESIKRDAERKPMMRPKPRPSQRDKRVSGFAQASRQWDRFDDDIELEYDMEDDYHNDVIDNLFEKHNIKPSPQYNTNTGDYTYSHYYSSNKKYD